MQTSGANEAPARGRGKGRWAALAAVLILAQCCICILPVWGYSLYSRQMAGSYREDSGLQVCAWAGARVVSFDFSQRVTVRQALPFEMVVGPAGVGFFDVCERRASGQ